MLDYMPEIAERAREIFKARPADSTPAETNETFIFAVDMAIRQKAKEYGISPKELKNRLGGFLAIYRAVLLM